MHDRPSIVVDEYLQMIYRLSVANLKVKASNLAERIQSSASTVHATLARMQRDELITLDEKKFIYLSQKGLKQAESLMLRHNLAEYFLCNTLGIPWYEVHKHAHQLEHALTPLVMEKMAEFLNFPKACPHGTPMPGYASFLPENLINLKDAIKDQWIRVVMIDENLEESEDLLKFLHENLITPGYQHWVKDRLEVTHTLVLESTQGQTNLPYDIAEKIYVVPVSKDGQVQS